jgi:serine O-acetyltransferase
MERISWKETYGRLRGDYANWLKIKKKETGLGAKINYLMHPGTIAVVMHRLAHYFYELKWKFLSRLIFIVQVGLTGAEIVPKCDIGGGFVLFHSTGTIISAKIGKNVIATGMIGIGGTGSSRDIGAGPGLPVIGDNVLLGPRITILGPVSIGDGVSIMPLSYVKQDVPPDSLISGNPARISAKVKASEYDILGRE